MLTGFKSEITDALESGQTQQHITKQFKDILDGAGHPELGDWHLESVVRSNMMTAYGVGHRKALEESADDLPFWEYSAVGDDRTRPTHRALDGIIYPANDPFWDEHFPPWGFNCRCSVIARIDMPDSYDHKRPNADTTIVFDKDGLPAKAEYLTQVVDLKATKFVGVPKTTNLETALTDAAKAAKDGRLLNHTGVPQTVVDKAREIRKSNVENSIAWNADGEFLGHFKGDKDSVNIPPAVATQMKQGFDLHNHPPEKGRYFEAPSDLDFIEAVNTDLKAFYVVTRNYLYQVRQPKNGWKPNSIADFDTIYDELRAKIAIDLLKKYRTETLTKEQISDIENHLIWKAVAKKMNFKYKRFELSEL